MTRMPEEKRLGVIAEIYRRADDLDWDGLRPTERSTWYARWLDEPAVGGVLQSYMARDQARMWIKDMPMKHYSRARSGIGPYAGLVMSRLPDAGTLASITFGCDWTLEGSVREKPNRCVVTDGAKRIQMIWGPPRAFPSLVWAGLNAVIDQGPAPVLVVLSRQGETPTDGQIDRHRQIADRVGVTVRHITTSASPTPARSTT